MHIKIDIECSPDEARALLGLPDLKPMQAAVMGEIETQMVEAARRFSPDAMLKSWISLVPQSPELMQQIFKGLFSGGLSGSGAGGSSGSGSSGTR